MEHKAQEKLKNLIRDVKAKKFAYIPKKKKPINWSAYSAAQYHEMNDYLNLVRILVDELKLDLGRNIDRGDIGPRLYHALIKQKQYLSSNTFRSATGKQQDFYCCSKRSST